MDLANQPDPHLSWQFVVNKFRIGTCLQLWPDESKGAVGSIYDRDFDAGITAEEFLSETYSQSFDTIVLHIFFGKWAIRGTKPFEIKQEQFVCVLAKTKQLAQRIIVTDHNRESGSFSELAKLPSSSEIRWLVESIFTDIITTFSGGYGCFNRNIILVCDR